MADPARMRGGVSPLPRRNACDEEISPHRRMSGVMKDRPYATPTVAISVHFFIMWALTYVGVAAFDYIFLNLNRFYTTMAMVMMSAMLPMFPNQ